MVVLGLVLILLAFGLLLAVVLGGADDRADYVVSGLELEVSTMTVFLLGGLTVLVLVLGFSLVRSGARRATQRRKDHKELDRLNAKLGERDAEPPPTKESDPQG